jgi:hypothetical protein
MDTLFSTRLQLESEINELIARLHQFANQRDDPFSEREAGWLRLEYAGDMPPVLGALGEQERFEEKVRDSVRSGYSAQVATDPQTARDFRALIERLRIASYAARLASPVIDDVSGEPIAKDVGRFTMMFIGQGMRILGLALIAFFVILVLFRC